MKRTAPVDTLNESGIEHSLKRVELVERNSTPNGYQMLNANHVGRHSSLDIVSLAREIQNADVALSNQTGKLSLILDQIRFLQSQAHQIIRDIKTDQSLHKAACNFKKIPGKTYYLYERNSGQSYFSMLSPQEWGINLAHKFIGGYRLEMDQTWTPLDRIGDVDEKKQLTRKLLDASNIDETFKRIDNCAELMMDSS